MSDLLGRFLSAPALGCAALAAMAIFPLPAFSQAPATMPQPQSQATSAPATQSSPQSAPAQPRAQVGVYYYEGWCGQNPVAATAPWGQPDAPLVFTEKLGTQFKDRQPLWGWRDDGAGVMERQIDLAADHGIAFFSFCWYWAPDANRVRKHPMNQGLEMFLKAKNNHRLKFCLMVANEESFQPPDEAAWKNAADQWLPYLVHPQSMRVEGKPLVIIYRPKAASGSPAAFEYLQAAARKAGLPGVTLAACGGAEPNQGYACATQYNFAEGWARGQEPHKYQELVEAIRKHCWPANNVQPYMPLVSAGWDNRPWVNPGGVGQPACWYYPDRSPEQFASFLRDAIGWMDAHPEQTAPGRVVMVYAWNELGEGGYIVPTKGDPEGEYLRAIRDVLAEPARATGPSR